MSKDKFFTTNNAEDNSQSTMTAGRMETFSNGVIAIIITIMVLELKPPTNFEPITLIQEGHIFLAYAMSFTIVSIYLVISSSTTYCT